MHWEDWPLEAQEVTCLADCQVVGRKISCGKAAAIIHIRQIPQTGYDLLCILWGRSKTPLIPSEQIVTEFTQIGWPVTADDIYRARNQARAWNRGHRITLLE